MFGNKDMETKSKIVLAAMTLLIMVGAIAMPVSAVGPSNQLVEFGNGNTEKVYPVIAIPHPGECGSDKDDLILQYNTYWGPRVDPNNVKWSSNSWFVRGYVNTMYFYGLSANGLGTTTTRVCVGIKAQVVGSGGLESIYLWHR